MAPRPRLSRRQTRTPRMARHPSPPKGNPRPRATRRSLATLVAMLALLGAPSAAAGDPVLAAAGDIACAPGSTVDATHCHQSATAELLLAQRPDVVATLGDNQYGTASYADFLGAFDLTWGRLKPALRPVAGNHEYTYSALAAGYTAYFGSAAAAAYSYEIGAWHVVALNSNCTAGTCADLGSGGTTNAQVQWLEADLAAHPTSCTLAYWHHPLFSSSTIGGSPGVRALWKTLYAHGADVVLGGHDHHYERMAQRDPSGSRTASGIRSFVV